MRVPPGNIVKITACDKKSGRPLKQALVWWTQDGTIVHRTTNAVTGAATFHGVPPGRIRFSVGHDTSTELDGETLVVPAAGTLERDILVRKKILVTGFCDWANDLSKSTWRCENNPSGMLLLGSWAKDGPAPADQTKQGPLSKLLLADKDYIWEILPLKVNWGAGSAIPWQKYDAVINLGLDSNLKGPECNEIHVENGAYNLHDDPPQPMEGKLVLGLTLPVPLPLPLPVTVTVPLPVFVPVPATFSHRPALAAALEQLAGAGSGDYKAVVFHGRPDNTYICNETTYYGIKATADPTSRLRAAMFLHLPYPAGQIPPDEEQAQCPQSATGVQGIDALATGVAGVIHKFLKLLDANNLWTRD